MSTRTTHVQTKEELDEEERKFDADLEKRSKLRISKARLDKKKSRSPVVDSTEQKVNKRKQQKTYTKRKAADPSTDPSASHPQ